MVEPALVTLESLDHLDHPAPLAPPVLWIASIATTILQGITQHLKEKKGSRVTVDFQVSQPLIWTFTHSRMK